MTERTHGVKHDDAWLEKATIRADGKILSSWSTDQKRAVRLREIRAKLLAAFLERGQAEALPAASSAKESCITCSDPADPPYGCNQHGGPVCVDCSCPTCKILAGSKLNG